MTWSKVCSARSDTTACGHRPCAPPPTTWHCRCWPSLRRWRDLGPWSALPAGTGLVIIGAEGALVLGGLACAAAACSLPLPGNAVGTAAACAAGALAGGLWLALAGWLRQY